MANTNLSLSLNRGQEGFRLDEIVVGTSAPGTGNFEFRMNAVDSNSNTILRLDAIRALKAFIRVLESQGTYTIDVAG